ncbi:hypothetical protein Syun_030748 [Stephania yunnanensis]|uniref:Uncharacterized protein n=1 Tax=Stephania yunnanensis TaxID=152371 RepID=A0AAP0DVQ4_9MAGN
MTTARTKSRDSRKIPGVVGNASRGISIGRRNVEKWLAVTWRRRMTRSCAAVSRLVAGACVPTRADLDGENKREDSLGEEEERKGLLVSADCRADSPPRSRGCWDPKEGFWRGCSLICVIVQVKKLQVFIINRLSRSLAQGAAGIQKKPRYLEPLPSTDPENPKKKLEGESFG